MFACFDHEAGGDVAQAVEDRTGNLEDSYRQAERRWDSLAQQVASATDDGRRLSRGPRARNWY